jgi:hypothetical protein
VKTKTAYRPKNIPEEPPQPSETVKINFATDTDTEAEPAATIVGDDAVTEALQRAVEADEASEALKRQLQHLHASEALQRAHVERMAQMAAPAPTLPAEPEARIALWRAHGLSDEDASYLQERPEMVQYPMITKAAYAATLQSGAERDSPAFAQTMEGNFAALLNQAQAQAQPAPASTFFEPSESPRLPATEHDRRVSIVSAPVSRTVPSGETGYRPARQITLTAQEQEFARIAGISDVEFAKQKQKLILAKANGDYGERR